MRSSDVVQRINDALPFLTEPEKPRDATTHAPWQSTGWQDTPIGEAAEVFDPLRFAIHEGNAEARTAGLHAHLDRLLDDEELQGFHQQMQAATRDLFADPEEPGTPRISAPELARRQRSQDSQKPRRSYAQDTTPCYIGPAKKRILV